MSASTIHSEALLAMPFPSGNDTHWETENQTIWNEREGTREELELV
jgi:hypothetical protein